MHYKWEVQFVNWIGYIRQHMQFGIFFSYSLPKNDNKASDITV